MEIHFIISASKDSTFQQCYLLRWPVLIMCSYKIHTGVIVKQMWDHSSSGILAWYVKPMTQYSPNIMRA